MSLSRNRFEGSKESYHDMEQEFDRSQEMIGKVDSFLENDPKIKERKVNRLQARDTFATAFATVNKRYPVGLNKDLIKIMDQLTSSAVNHTIIPIIGMAGLGNTTLARYAYNNPLITYHFDIRIWKTVSSEYQMEAIIMDLLDSKTHGGKLELQEKGIEQLSAILYNTLKGRRYLIVLDDVWDTAVWDYIKTSIPYDRNGSRILLTTQLEKVAIHATPPSHIHRMSFLNLDDSWELLREKIFGNNHCPPEFETVGKTIVGRCQGLPLAIVSIGDILSKFSSHKDFLKIAKSLAEKMDKLIESLAEKEDNLMKSLAQKKDKSMKTLSLSYNYLPNDLKACFLYMGVFPEDFEIPVTQLINLWVAEGLLKPLSRKSFEEVGSEYVTDLIGRNLVLVSKRSFNGKIQTCSIHSVWRDFVIKKAVDEKFFQSFPQGRCKKHSISAHSDVFHCATGHDSPVSSLLYFGEDHVGTRMISVVLSCRMLKVLDALAIRFNQFPYEIVELVNLRYLAVTLRRDCHLRASIANLQNLRTLVVSGATLHLPSEIWKMPNLRHLLFDRSFLTYPFFSAPFNKNDYFVLEHLYTLSQVTNFRCTDDVLFIMPNLKKLGISYFHDEHTEWASHKFNNFVSLHKLESLKCLFIAESFATEKALPVNFAFPLNLRKLTLSGCRFSWNRMTIVGSLPILEVLKLKDDAFQGEVWESWFAGTLTGNGTGLTVSVSERSQTCDCLFL